MLPIFRIKCIWCTQQDWWPHHGKLIEATTTDSCSNRWVFLNMLDTLFCNFPVFLCLILTLVGYYSRPKCKCIYWYPPASDFLCQNNTSPLTSSPALVLTNGISLFFICSYVPCWVVTITTPFLPFQILLFHQAFLGVLVLSGCPCLDNSAPIMATDNIFWKLFPPTWLGQQWHPRRKGFPRVIVGPSHFLFVEGVFLCLLLKGFPTKGVNSFFYCIHAIVIAAFVCRRYWWRPDREVAWLNCDFCWYQSDQEGVSKNK